MTTAEAKTDDGAGPAAEVRSAPHKRSAAWEMFENVLRHALERYNRAVARRSVHGDHNFFDPTLFPWVASVESEWKTIRTELDSVLANEPIPEFGEISPDQAH